jgi:hypothetical protein
LKLISLAATNENLKDELNSIESASENGSTINQQIKKPVTSLTIKSKNEYNVNFRAIISQNLKIKSSLDNNKSSLHLLKLVINNCELQHINAAIFKLDHLNHLDLSNNKLELLDNFHIDSLNDLIMSNNQLKSIGKNCKLPKLVNLILDNNNLSLIDHAFCKNFSNVSKLILNRNKIKYLHHKFGYYFSRLKHFEANHNELDVLPFSFSYLRLNMLDLMNNSYQYISLITRIVENKKKFPTLVELAGRSVVNKKVKYTITDIPRELYQYIDINYKCNCGYSCFEYQFNSIQMYSLSQIAKEFSCFSLNGFDNQVPLLLNLCSFKCYAKNKKFSNLV